MLIFRTQVASAVWLGVELSVAGLALLSGVGAGDPVGDLLVLAGSAAYLPPDRSDGALRARYGFRSPSHERRCWLAFCGFAVVAVALGQVEVPRGWTV